MDSAVPDDNVRGPSVNPPLVLQLGEQLLTDRPIINSGIGRQLASCGGKRAHQVCSADDAEKLAVFNDGDTLDPLCLE